MIKINKIALDFEPRNKIVPTLSSYPPPSGKWK